MTKSPHFEGPQDDEEAAGRQVGQEPAPCGAHGKADTGNQGGKGGRLHPEVAEDGHNQDDVQRDRDKAADIADQARVDLLFLEGALHHAPDKADEPSADDPEYNGSKDLGADSRGIRHEKLLVLRCVFHTWSLLESGLPIPIEVLTRQINISSL